LRVPGICSVGVGLAPTLGVGLVPTLGVGLAPILRVKLVPILHAYNFQRAVMVPTLISLSTGMLIMVLRRATTLLMGLMMMMIPKCLISLPQRRSVPMSL